MTTGYRTLALVASLLLLSSCGRSGPIEPTPGGAKAGPTFVYAAASEPRTLDPGLITDTYSSFFAQNLFEGLLIWDQAGQATQPGIAERHEVSHHRDHGWIPGGRPCVRRGIAELA